MATALPYVDTTGRAPQVGSGGGQVQLRVRFTGVPPVPVAPDSALPDRPCRRAPVDDVVRLSRDGGVVAALVWVDGRRLAAPRRGHRIVVALTDCTLAPATAVEPIGGTLDVLQRDSVRDSIVVQHVARPTADTIVFDADGEIVPLHTRDWPAGAVTLRSLRFPWSRSIVLFAPNGTARLTSDAGTATIDSLVPGRHVLHVWHPRLGEARTTITVRAGATVPATITFGAAR
ncbi:MAG: hypothetical protein MUF40_07990 [Gemmatimonadaceae bacterium]|nr:hypothetical protein [Gemmatimonadaceae bacterium]